MQIALIGTGYVGLPTGAGFAKLGHNVACIDRDAGKIERLERGEAVIFEDGLGPLLAEAISSGRLSFTTSIRDGLRGAEIAIIAAGTPTDPQSGSADTSQVETAAAEAAKCAARSGGPLVIAVKSTVPAGTCDAIEEKIRRDHPGAQIDIVSLPEFLREGFAVGDFFHPDRVIAGTSSERAKAAIRELYGPLGIEPTFVSRRSSELIKYASNAFLAAKVSYINEIADLCRAAKADIGEVAAGMGMDSRIGGKFLVPGPGWGGSCFGKDTGALVSMARKYGMRLMVAEAAAESNALRKKEMARRIADTVFAAGGGRTDGRKVAVLGLAFKGGTDDVRDSPAVEIASELARIGLSVAAFDPKAAGNARRALGDKIEYAGDAYSASAGADALAILCDWDEFARLDFGRLAASMRGRIIADFRGIADRDEAARHGFEVIGI